MKVERAYLRGGAVGRLRVSRHSPPVFLLAMLSCLSLLVLNVFLRVEYSGDEGFYGVTAANMLRSPDAMLRPSYYPGGDFNTDRDAFAHPPFNSYIYALGLGLLGGSRVGPELLNVAAFGLLLWAAWGITRAFQPRAAPYAVALMAVSPAMLLYYSQLEAEPWLTSFGALGLYCTVRANRGVHWRWWLMGGGLCIGAAFGLKLWLCGPMALAMFVAVMVQKKSSALSWRRNAESLLILGAGSMVPALAHLAAIGWVHPEDLRFWLRNIYFGVFTGLGISGGKLAGLDASPEWVHPIWYYLPALYRDHFFLVPPLLLGLGVAMRNRLSRPLLWILGAGLAGLVPLSLLKVKEPLYVLTCAALLYVLAGVCVAAIARQAAAGAFCPSRLSIGAIVFLWIIFPVAYAKGIMPGKITGSFVVAHSLVFPAWLIWGLGNRRREWSGAMRLLFFGGAAAALLVCFVHGVVTRQPRDAIIAELLRPYVASNAPRTLSLIASNYKSYQFLLYRSGCYWKELPEGEAPQEVLRRPEYRQVRAFILDSEEGGKASLIPWVAWLASNAQEITSQLDARLHRKSGFRIFVSQDTGKAGDGVAIAPEMHVSR